MHEYLYTLWRVSLTCEDAEGKLTPSSFRDLMVAPTRLSCGSFWKSSAHSTIRAFSFSHTFGWAYRGQTHRKLRFFLITQGDTDGWPQLRTKLEVFSWGSIRPIYVPCSAHSVLHWQTRANRFPSGIFCHSLTHMHPVTAREERQEQIVERGFSLLFKSFFLPLTLLKYSEWN